MASRGVTILELLIGLLLVGVLAGFLIGPVRHQGDALVLRGAREEVVSLFHRARMEARTRGDAVVLLATGQDPLILLSDPDGEDVQWRVPLQSLGVELEVMGSRDAAELAYGPLGVAGFAATSVMLRRRDAELRLVVSSYGRVRR